MSVKVSKLYGMDIFSDAGRYLGKVYDIIIDIEKGEVVRLTLEPVHAATREEAARVLREKTVLYKNVKSVEDVVIVTRGAGYPGFAGKEEKEEEIPAGFPFK